MNKNYITQVVWLVVLTVGFLLLLSTLPSHEINYKTKQIDILSDLRTDDGKYETDPSEEEQPAEPKSIAPEVDEAAETHKTDPVPEQPIAQVKRREGDITLIEDYSEALDGIQHLATAIDNRNNLNRPIRIAFLGDSYIEADILTQNIRQSLQDLYGGSGVGYMAMHSDFPGFRRSVTQSDKGWTTHSVAKKSRWEHTSLPLQLHIPSKKGATTRYKGVKKLRHIDSWERSKVMFIAQDSAVITLKTDSTLHTYDIAPSDEAQCITLNEKTSSLEVKCDNPNIVFWGCWLDDDRGIAIDNISMRGYSGTSIDKLPLQRLQELNGHIPYDMIVLQYGLNRMTPTITNYDAYTAQLKAAVEHLRDAFPNTAILIMGVGDRCQNENGQIETLQAVYGMIKAQRRAAFESGCLFWDTYQAMKMLGGMPAFVENKWGNKDYTHINHAGGVPLGEEFVKALSYALENQ